MPCRFPPPWTVTRTTGGWKVVDATGRAVAYTCGDDSAQGAGSPQMTVEEARRIARLPSYWAAEHAAGGSKTPARDKRP
jgi:hypothetical protein